MEDLDQWVKVWHFAWNYSKLLSIVVLNFSSPVVFGETASVIIRSIVFKWFEQSKRIWNHRASNTLVKTFPLPVIRIINSSSCSVCVKLYNAIQSFKYFQIHHALRKKSLLLLLSYGAFLTRRREKKSFHGFDFIISVVSLLLFFLLSSMIFSVPYNDVFVAT